jgi:pyruvate ferredoxin oxidoreductase delta subunit
MIKRDGILQKEKLRTWRQVDPGGQVMTPGSSVNYRSSDWSSVVAEWIPDICTQCLMCWVFCPDNCILVQADRVVGVDEYYCKGCGICIEICPTDPKSLIIKKSAEGKE